MLRLKTVSSLEKILPKYDCNSGEISELVMLSGETASFQIAYSSYEVGAYGFEIEHDSQTEVEAYFAGNVPVGMATLPNALNDPDYITHEPALLPNLLTPCDRDWVYVNDLWHAMWFTVKAGAGSHRIKVTFTDYKGEPAGECELTVTVLAARLPEQELIFTQWFHCDCIASYYGYKMFSEEHWTMIENFLRLANENGINMILTPVFTPPLDTEVGKERPTAQLLGIKKQGDRYDFDFSAVRRWIRLCRDIGFKYFEMPHLFTQWGAKAAPKIVAEENGEEKRIFGWDTAADSPEYDSFLSQLLPALKEVLREEGVFENTYFHISDEPTKDSLEYYSRARAVAKKYLDGCRIIDALSHTEYYEKGYVEIPIPELCVIKDWLSLEVPQRWCYYCCGDVEGVSNRFVSMPSARNRSIGVQMYKHRMDGFLHWGYNFYYSKLSRLEIDPYAETDAHGGFSSGDAFSVYPGKNGALPTISLFVFNEALQDMRALKLLEGYIGYEAVVELVEKELGETVSFYHCFNAERLLSMRAAVNRRIAEFIKQ